MRHIQTSQTGSVILEALIAILIFSMGILALVGMQGTAISNVSDAQYRSSAGFLAQQIIGSIWANSPVGTNASNVMAATLDVTSACNPCTTANGNAYTQAWMASGVLASLPSGTASIVISGVQVTVTLGWTPPTRNATQGAVAHRHVVSAFVN